MIVLHSLFFFFFFFTNINVALSLSISTGALYVRKYFKEEAKRNALEMVEDIRTEFIKILQDLEWMDASTRCVMRSLVNLIN